MDSIYNEITRNSKNRYFKKISLFFNLKEHSCDTLNSVPKSVFDEYLKMHLKDKITYEDAYELLRIDYKNTMCCLSLDTNLLEYLSYYIDVSKLGHRPRIGYMSNLTTTEEMMEDVVRDSMEKIFSTREGQIFKLIGASLEK